MKSLRSVLKEVLATEAIGVQKYKDDNEEMVDEGAPSEKETYLKIKDFNMNAMKGYAKKIKLDKEIIQGAKNAEDLLAEIMDFLFDEDWMSKTF